MNAIQIFTEVAHYLNEINWNIFSAMEVKSAIEDYYAEYEYCKANGKRSFVIDGILENLAYCENDEKAREFEKKIKTLLPQYSN